MRKKEILYYFPANPLGKPAGNVARSFELLTYFQSRNINVDFIYNRDHYGGALTREELDELAGSGLVDTVYELIRKPPIRPFFSYLFQYKIHKIYKSILRKHHLPNYVTYYNQAIFNNIVKNKKYDYIIISYAFWAHLIKDNPYIQQAKLIIDTHDLLTSQEQLYNSDLQIGTAFSEEISRLNFFDEIWAISSDEYYLFSQFCKKPVRLIPMAFKSKLDIKRSSTEAISYDLIFVGGDNPHNVTGIRWFFENVYPLLPGDIRICIIGKINAHVNPAHNVTQISFAKKLDEYYNISRVAICPLLTGTGVKVKVIEALSYGLPVVCTPRGVDGMINKLNNGCIVSEDPKQFADNIIHLLTDAENYKNQEKMARETFRTQYTTDALYQKLDAIF